MATDRFLIAPYDNNSGQQTNVKPWLIFDEAFDELTNAYQFRGVVRKRWGSKWMGNDQYSSRLRINIGMTDGSGNFTGFIPLNTSSGFIVEPAIGQLFSIGSTSFTVVSDMPPYDLLRSDGNPGTATYDFTTGAVTINTAAVSTNIFFYPALPVMGLPTEEASDLNSEPVIGFDTRFSYKYLNGGWVRLATETDVGASFWLGDNADFFWATTWKGTNAADNIFFVTNNNENEYVVTDHPVNLRYLDPAESWHNFRPQVSATEYLNNALLVVVFKNRLLYFNTWEGVIGDFVGTNYSNRVRYSQIGSPLDAVAYRQDIPGKGNAIDAPTAEAITTVEFVNDRLLVFFERSTYELVYQGNQNYPFAFQQINTELGVESTFSVVPFDKFCIGVGNVGIHRGNSLGIERIDDKIPDTVFAIHNDNDGVKRVYGIRDYYTELVYWTFPSTDASDELPYPNRILVYNYKTGTWAFFEDSVTVFGYFQQTNAVNWGSTTIKWSDPVLWSSGSIQGRFRQVLAGNQQGYTFICDSELPKNAGVLQITTIFSTGFIVTITSIDHNLREGEYVLLQGIIGTDTIPQLNNKIYKVIAPITKDTFSIEFPLFFPAIIIDGDYLGSGTIARVSNWVIKTKEFNFYAKQGRNSYISKLDCMVDTTSVGKTQIDFYISTNSKGMVNEAEQTGSLLGTSTLDTFPYNTFEADTTRVIHPVYFQADGEWVQFKISMSDDQIRQLNISEGDQIIGPGLEDFQLHFLIIYAQPTSYRFQ